METQPKMGRKYESGSPCAQSQHVLKRMPAGAGLITGLMTALLLQPGVGWASTTTREEVKEQPLLRLQAPTVLVNPTLKVPSMDGGDRARQAISAMRRESLPVTQVAQAHSQTPGPEESAAALYQLLKSQLASGNKTDASRNLKLLLQYYPETAAAKDAELHLQALLAEGASPSGTPILQGDNSGRAEFIASQALVWGLAGVSLILPDPFGSGSNHRTEQVASRMSSAGCGEWNDCVVTGLITGALTIGLTVWTTGGLLAMGGGLASSAAASHTEVNPISHAQAQSWFGTQLIVGSNAMLWNRSFGKVELDEITYTSTKFVFLPSLIVGTIGGRYMSRHQPLSEGQVTTVLHAALWAPVLTHWFSPSFGAGIVPLGGQASNLETSSRVISVPMMASAIAQDVAVVGATALMLKTDLPISRSRVQLISVAGLLGAAAGWGVYALSPLQMDAETSTRPLMTGIGALAGLTVGALATSGWDKTAHPELFNGSSNSLLDVQDGKLRLGAVVPNVSFQEVKSGSGAAQLTELKPRVELSLASGTF